MTVARAAVWIAGLVVILTAPSRVAADQGHAPVRTAAVTRTTPEAGQTKPAAAPAKRDEHAELERAVMRIVDEIRKPDASPGKARSAAAQPVQAPARIRLIWRARLTWPQPETPAAPAPLERLPLTWR